jgi:hypothetical protein
MGERREEPDMALGKVFPFGSQDQPAPRRLSWAKATAPSIHFVRPVPINLTTKVTVVTVELVILASPL